MRYPESGFITYGEAELPDEGAAVPGVKTTDDNYGSEDSLDHDSTQDTTEEAETAVETGNFSFFELQLSWTLGNALLGTATGLIILGIIIGLILFVRKRSRQNRDNAEYKVRV